MESWGTPLRDTLANFELKLLTNKFYEAFFECDGQTYKTPYQNILDKIPGTDLSPTRIETLKKLFQDACLLRVKESDDTKRIEITPLGAALGRKWANAHLIIENERKTLATSVIQVLNRYQLINPTTVDRFDSDTSDIFPYRAIWQAMLELDDRLHAEELNRVLLRATTQVELKDAIEKIRVARSQPNYDPNNQGIADSLLGPRVFSDPEQAARRMTPWFSMAGFGGLLFNEDGRTWRSLKASIKPTLLKCLDKCPEYVDFGNNEDAWYSHLFSQIEPTATELSINDQNTFSHSLEVIDKHAHSKFILFSGVAGTGKSRMADMVAMAICDNDLDRKFEVQFHEYFLEGLQPTPEGGFIPVDIIFRLANKAAQKLEKEHPNKRVVLLVEEFSRAKLSNVLGELMTYVEHRDRLFHYPISGETDHIAKNLVIIGTMNPLDRSVLDMDDALIRRTRRIEFKHNSEALKEILEGNMLEKEVIDFLVAGIEKCASKLPFGHGVFSEISSEEELNSLWNEQLMHYFVNPIGLARHPALEQFRSAFPWIDPNFRVPRLTPELPEKVVIEGESIALAEPASEPPQVIAE